MKKTYHFMAGLPRSGSTVLSALLNQHPNIYASPQTDLIAILYDLSRNIPSYDSYKAGLMHTGYDNIMNGVVDNFYSHIDKPIIINKHRGWGTPYNFNYLAPFVNNNGKVILTLRPILEVLASFIKASQKTEKQTKFAPYLDSDLWVSSYRSSSEAQVEYIMRPNGEIDMAIFSIANLLKNHKDRVEVVWFDDLVKTPQKTMNKIYNFLELKDNIILLKQYFYHKKTMTFFGLLSAWMEE
jgi:sulfotransferase